MDTLKKFNLKVWRVMQVLELHLQEGDGGGEGGKKIRRVCMNEKTAAS